MIVVDTLSIEILAQDDSGSALSEGQLSAYKLLTSLEDGDYPLRSLVQQCNLRSHLPLLARFKHLEEKGLIRITRTEKVVG